MQVMPGVSLRARWDATLVILIVETSIGLNPKAHQTRITNRNQEIGKGEGWHEKMEPADDLGWKCNFEEKKY